ncbi:MAG: hypothetical protein FD130_302 [Halothiobacillaceae bacterium]|nr:MAG: hypothetical protein FD130_302 [Halothiobacillaceae bacterium]
MGLLDELRDQAETLKSSSEYEKERQERLLTYYKNEINPRMMETYRFLHELVTHLNYVKPEITTSYTLPVVGNLGQFKQGDYKIVADSDTEMKEIKLQFSCDRAGGDITFRVKNKLEMEKAEEHLLKHYVRYYCKKERDERYNVTLAEFTVNPSIPVMVRFVAEIEESTISLQIVNHEGLDFRKVILTPDKITTGFLEQFGNYLLRREADFLRTELSEEERRRIRLRMIEEQRHLEMEVQAHLLEEELAYQKRAKMSVFKKLFGRLKDDM